MENNKFKVYVINDGETSLVYDDMDSALLHIQIVLEEKEIGDQFDLNFKVVEMTDEELMNLPEFDG